jgi:polar amino acid transport system substrate-binding protein
VTIRQTRHRAVAIGAVVLSGALALTACGSTKAKTDLDRIKKAGKITIATDASYAPNEYVENGKIVGFDVDLGNAIAKKLGVTANVQNAAFDSIIPALKSKKFDISLSSFTDSKEREGTVDFVTYYSAGTSLQTKAGNPLKLSADDLSLCGMKVATEKGTTQEADVKSDGLYGKKCTAASKKAPQGLSFDDQNQANLALASGRAEAVLADSPVVAWAVKNSQGKFEVAGQPYGTAPYGIAIPKNEPQLRDAILKAVKDMMADGSYKQIVAKWGLDAGAINNAQVNGATS